MLSTRHSRTALMAADARDVVRVSSGREVGGVRRSAYRHAHPRAGARPTQKLAQLGAGYEYEYETCTRTMRPTSTLLRADDCADLHGFLFFRGVHSFGDAGKSHVPMSSTCSRRRQGRPTAPACQSGTSRPRHVPQHVASWLLRGRVRENASIADVLPRRYGMCCSHRGGVLGLGRCPVGGASAQR